MYKIDVTKLTLNILRHLVMLRYPNPKFRTLYSVIAVSCKCSFFCYIGILLQFFLIENCLTFDMFLFYK